MAIPYHVKNSQRALSNNLRTDDIEDAKPFSYLNKFRRKSPRNPLEPFEQPSPLGKKGQLKYFGPKPLQPFYRDNMITDDIEGAACNTHSKRHYMIRNNLRSDDVPGAQVKQYHRFYHNKEGYMGPKDPPAKSMADLRQYKSNPLSPKYRVATEKQGTTEIIGEITGNRPKQHYKRSKVNYDRDNLYCTSQYVDWTPQNEKFKPKLKQIRQFAGAHSSQCNQGNVFVAIQSGGKRKYNPMDDSGSLEGILAAPRLRIHDKKKPPIPKQTQRRKKQCAVHKKT